MSGNSFGTIFKVTTFGESHGDSIGCIIDGCPAGIPIDITKIQEALDKRKPGAQQIDDSGIIIFNAAVTARNEADKAHIVSGIFDNEKSLSIPLSTGTPITVIIKNTSQKSKDYSAIKNTFRPGHADYTYESKYEIRDYRGGGRSSGRETAARVAAGAIAQMVIDALCKKNNTKKTKIIAWTKAVETLNAPCPFNLESSPSSIEKDIEHIESIIKTNPLRCCNTDLAKQMTERIESLRKNGESCGGVVQCAITGVAQGLGEPVFDKLDAELAKAMLSIGAVKGIEFGSGFQSTSMKGSEWNDSMTENELFESNHAGGILGGISSSAPIIFSIAIKPVPSIFKKQKTVSMHYRNGIKTLKNTEIEIEGRHDICLCPRIVPVVEAMSAIVIADMMLRNLSSHI